MIFCDYYFKLDDNQYYQILLWIIKQPTIFKFIVLFLKSLPKHDILSKHSIRQIILNKYTICLEEIKRK